MAKSIAAKKLEAWGRDQSARQKWQEFLSTPEAERGLEVMRSRGVPIIIIGESNQTSAQRQHFQAGFHAALEVIASLPELHFVKNEQITPEWGYVGDESELEDQE